MNYLVRIFLCILLLAAVGCATSPPARFYLLSPPASQSMADQMQKTVQVSLQVQVPDYLDRPQIMIREDTHRLSLAELDRWAEPLSRMLTQFLARHLTAGPLPVQVNTPDSGRDDVRIWIQILRLDGKPGGRVTLETNYRIASPEMNEGRVYFFSAAAPASGQGLQGLVQAHEQVVLELASELTQALQVR